MRRLATFAVAAVAVGTFATLGTAQTTQVAPRNTAPPTIQGTAQAGQQLRASPGTWAGDTPMVFTYQWLRCNAAGNNCVAVPGADARDRTYTVRNADVGGTLRVAVTARNATGAATARSAQTAVVTARPATPPPPPPPPSLPPGAQTLPGGVVSIPVTSVSPPHRLIVERVAFTPNPVRSRSAPIGIRVRVTDTRGFVVRGALVFVRSTPLVTSTPPETPTALDGWATMQAMPRADFPLRRGYNVQFFARARKAGDNVLAGVSGRRLVQVRTAPA